MNGKNIKNINKFKNFSKKIFEGILTTSFLLAPISVKIDKYKAKIETMPVYVEISKSYGQVKEVGWFESIFTRKHLNLEMMKSYYNYLNNDEYFRKIHEELDKNGNGYIDEQELKDLILEKLDKGEAKFDVYVNSFGDWSVDIKLSEYNNLGIGIFLERGRGKNPLQIEFVGIAVLFSYKGGVGIIGDEDTQSLSSLMEEYENIYGEEFQYPSSFDVKVNGIEPYKERFIKLAALIVEKYLSTVKLWIKIYQHRETGSYLFSAFVKAPNLGDPDKGKYTYTAYTYVEPQDDIALQLKAEWDDNRELEVTDMIPLGNVYPYPQDSRWAGIYFEGDINNSTDDKNYFVGLMSARINRLNKENEEYYYTKDKSKFNLPDTIRFAVRPILDK